MKHFQNYTFAICSEAGGDSRFIWAFIWLGSRGGGPANGSESNETGIVVL